MAELFIAVPQPAVDNLERLVRRALRNVHLAHPPSAEDGGDEGHEPKADCNGHPQKDAYWNDENVSQ